MRRWDRHDRHATRDVRHPRVAALLGAAFIVGLLGAACGTGAGDAIKTGLTNLPTVTRPTPTRTLPTTEEPTTEAPTTEAPTTEAPTTEAPTTEAPTTDAPTTEAPTTDAPTTEAPTTEAPTTEAPTTEAPTTEAPTTEAPTTEVTVTATPVGDEGGGNGWIWLLVAGVLFLLLYLFAIRGRGEKGPTWQSQVLTIYSLGATYRDALTLEVAAPSSQAAPEASARWTELEQQADELNARLHALEANPPNETAAAAVAQALAALGAVRSAARTYRTTGQVADAETVRTRLRSLEQAIDELRLVRS